MKHFLLANTLLWAFACVAQQPTNPYLIKVGTVSPEAASLGKFGNIPVNYSTGIPSITIPIYEINIGKTKVPVSIDYHAGGIRLDEVASSVGLGWALKCGGMISRNVMGLADDDGSNGYWHTPRISSIIAQPENHLQYISGVVDGSRDVTPDQFSYNINGESGKFYFDQDTTVVQFPVSANKIEWYYDNALTFRITDEKGSIYLFERPELYVPGSVMNQQPSSYLNVWHLTRIIDPNMVDTIYFNYESGCSGSSYEPIASGTYRLGTIASCDVNPNNSDPVEPGLRDANEYTEIHRTNSFTPYYLSSVTWRGGKIVFTNACDRLDRPYEKRVSEITVYATDKTTQTQIKKIRFFHSYITSTQGTPYNYFGTAVQDAKNRLRLDSLGFYSAVTSEQPQLYRMQYDNTEMAARETYAQDVWGFNNGQWQNGSLMAKQLIRGFTNGSGIYMDKYLEIGNANREASELYMKAGTLRSIQYPTGGRTEFELEPHQYSTDQFALNTQSISCIATGSINQTSTNTFTVEPSWENIRYSCYFSSFNYVGVTDRPRGNITDQTTGQVVTNFSSATDPNTSYSCGLMPITLIAGHTYTINVNIYTTTVAAVNADITLTWDKPSTTIEIKKGGGLRVKSIKNYDNTGNLLNQELYKYGENESGEGVLSIPYTFYSMNQENIISRTNCPDVGVMCQNIIGYPTKEFHTGSLFPVSQVAGSPVLYKTVTKYQLDYTGAKSNGKTVYEYWVYQDVEGVPGPDIDRAGLKMISNSWRNGRLKKESIYRSNSVGGYVLKEEKEFVYALERSTYHDCLQIKGKYAEAPGDRCQPLSVLYGEVYLSLYSIQSGKYLLLLNQRTLYDDSARAQVVNQMYTYTDTSHLFPTSKQTYDSKGDTAIQYIKYPGDFAVTGNVYDKMKKRHITSQVVSEQKLISGVQQSLTTINYSDWFQDNKLFLPNSVNGQLAANPVETQVRFNRFDKYGNIQQQQKEKDIYQSYIWDYQSVYPVAQCSNGAYDSIAYTSFEADSNGNWNVPSVVRTANGITGNKCYQLSNGSIYKPGLAAGTTYIVSYWTTNTSAFTIAGTIGSVSPGKKIGSWTYFEHKVTGVTQVTLPQVTGLIDELRLYPANAQMTTYTYAPLTGMTSTCSPNNTITYYEYDGHGRLKLVKDQNGHVTKTLEYHYKE